MEKVKNSEVISRFDFASCLNKIQSMGEVSLWLENPLAANFLAIKQSCLPEKAGPCEGKDCNLVGKEQTT